MFIEPTLFANATNDLKISREEIFGPVLPIIPFEGEDEAVRIANDTPYGLASGVQTSDLSRALRIADRIKAGTVCLNTWHKYHPNAPFGGYRMSGFGREQGAERWKATLNTNLSGPILASPTNQTSTSRTITK